MSNYFDFRMSDDVERSRFANDVSRLLILSTNGNVDKAVPLVERYYEHFSLNVQNFYEIAESEVPLFALYLLRKNGAKNYGFTEKEYLQAEKNCLQALIEMLDSHLVKL